MNFRSKFNGKPLKFSWNYLSSDGKILGSVARYELNGDKEIIPFFKGIGPNFKTGAAPTPHPLFGLNVIANDHINQDVFLVEGERCAAALHSLGLVAITSQGGSKAASTSDWKPLSGRARIVMLPDNDESGSDYARDVAAILATLDAPPELVLLELPNLPPAGDVVDWLFSRLPDATAWDGFGPLPETDRDRLANEFQTLVKTKTVPFLPTDNKSPVVGAWHPPVPLDAAPLPEWPGNVFPPDLQAFVDELSRSTETPPELAAMVVLSVLATATQGKFQVCVKSGYVEPLSLWCIVALPPASRKTAIFQAATAPLTDWERRKRESLLPTIQKAESNSKTAIARISKLRTMAASKHGPDLDKLNGEILELEKKSLEIPKIPQVWSADVTPENLATLMADNHDRMAILTDEGGIFELMAGRYSNGVPNIDVFLQGHSGSPVRVNRGSRPPVFMHLPALSMGLTVQPDVIRGLCAKPGFRGRGLLGRFLYALPVSNIGHRNGDAPPMPNEIKTRYAEIITALLDIPTPTGPDDGRPVAHILTMTDDALTKWQHFWGIVEKKMKDGGEFAAITDWAGKLSGAVARLAGCLHVSEHAMGRPWDHPITFATMAAAVRLGDTLAVHALAAFDLMGADPAIEDARIVLRWLKREGQSQFTFRDCHYAHKSRFRRTEELEPALAVLTERHFIRQVAQREKVSHRPSRTYDVNPEILS
ncbi:MAG: DUF3987 domain-containing protein [Magnetococcales bacterium]|nr:DUF3987 domain-containing protein [Magnetococcales bacterium]